jgi:hypothetical protein
MLMLPGQVLSFCSKLIIAKYQSRGDGMADIRKLLVAQVIGEEIAVGRLSRLMGLYQLAEALMMASSTTQSVGCCLVGYRGRLSLAGNRGCLAAWNGSRK